MIIDERTQFSNSGDFATEIGTSNVGDLIDLGAGVKNVGAGRTVYLTVVVETAADGGAGTNGTTAFQLASDATSTVAVDGSQTIHFTSDAFGAAALTAGTILTFALPSQTYERYLALQIVQATEGEDDLVCSAYLSFDNVPSHEVYADGAN